MSKSLKEIIFKASYWNYEDVEDDEGNREFVIYVSGTTEENESIFCTIKNFQPYVYLELPSGGWSSRRIESLMEYLIRSLRTHSPVRYEPMIKKNLYFLREMECIKLWFKTDESAKRFSYFVQKNMRYIPDVGRFPIDSFKVHEHSIDPIIKLETINKIRLSSWLKVKPLVPPHEEGLTVDERRYTTSDIDCYVDHKDVRQHTDILKQIHQKYISFDIEAYSSNHNAKMPDPTNIDNVIFQISCVIGETGREEKQLRYYLLSLDDPIIENDEKIQVFKYETERDLLLGFSALIVNEDPDLIYGYNILGFDWSYIVTRATILKILNKFMLISKIIGKKAEIKKNDWASSAYGKQELVYPNCHGRINVDVLIEIQRNYKLPKYTLDYVSEHFLKEKKDDITARQMFIIWRCVREIKTYLRTCEESLSIKETRILRKKVQKIFPLLRCSGEARLLRKKLLQAKNRDQAIRAISVSLGKIGKYCVKDSLLADKLIRFLNLDMVMDELSNYMCVPKSYLHTRGQQIKVIAQIYIEAQQDNVVIPYSKKDSTYEQVKGAIVFEPKRGFYPLTAISDFESLYPTMIISANIDYTTYIDPQEKIDDSKCNKIDCSIHEGCIHDKSVEQKNDRKGKRKIYCQDRVERFRKVEIDGEGNKKNEGILPRLERNLMSSRRAVKFELLKAESKLKMLNGTATPGDIEFYRSKGWKIITEVSKEKHDRLKRKKIILNVQQLVIKVCANSVYGALGAKTGYAPFIPGANAVTALARWSITNAVKYILDTNKEATLVYGDTDSCIIDYKLGRDKIFEKGEQVVKDTTHHLKCLLMKYEDKGIPKYSKERISIRDYSRDKISLLSEEERIKIYEYDSLPINLQFENVYCNLLMLSKKKYMADVVNKKGVLVSKIKKGNVLVKLGNSKYLRDTYQDLCDQIFGGKSEEEVNYLLCEWINRLFTRQIRDIDLVIYTTTRYPLDYAKKKNSEFINEDGTTIDNITGPFDSRLVYTSSNLSRLLSMKMMERGDIIPPNGARLEYIYLKTLEPVHYAGEKAEDYTYYRESKKIYNYKIDRVYYLTKQLTNPIEDLLSAKFERKVTVLESLQDTIQSQIEELNDLWKRRVKRTTIVEFSFKDSKELSQIDIEDTQIGYDVSLKNISEKVRIMRTLQGRGIENKGKRYKYTGFDAKVVIILGSFKKRLKNPKIKNELDRKHHQDLYLNCLKWHSRQILTRNAKYYNLPRKTYRVNLPKKIKIKRCGFTEVCLKKNYKDLKRGTLLRVVEYTDDPDTYLCQVYPSERRLEIHRDYLAKFDLLNNSIMRNITEYRKNYEVLVESLQSIVE